EVHRAQRRRAPPLSTESSTTRLSGATFVALFVAALTIWFAVRVVEVLLLVFLAALCAVYLSAITDVLERRFRFRRWLGLATAVVATLAAVAGIGALLVPPVIEQTQALVSGLPQTLTDIQTVVARWASQYPVLRQTDLAEPTRGLVASLVDDASSFLRGSILPYVRAGGKLFIEGASVIVMALYIAVRPRMYRDGVLSLVAPKHRAVGARVLDDASATLRAWVVGQLLAMLVLGVLTALGLWARRATPRPHDRRRPAHGHAARRRRPRRGGPGARGRDGRAAPRRAGRGVRRHRPPRARGAARDGRASVAPRMTLQPRRHRFLIVA